jgi:hypothetical protein
LRPKHTIRIVFWVNEENGDAGGRAYRDMVGPEGVKQHVAAIEMDGGSERPLGIAYGGFGLRPKVPGSASAPFQLDDLSEAQQKSFRIMPQIAALLQPISVDRIFPDEGGSDIEPITEEGVPTLSPQTVAEHYFDWHHTEADTLDKVDVQEFRHNIALLAITSYVLADSDARLTSEKRAEEYSAHR